MLKTVRDTVGRKTASAQLNKMKTPGLERECADKMGEKTILGHRRKFGATIEQLVDIATGRQTGTRGEG